MQFDTFAAGVAPGGLISQNEVKVLICYLLSHWEEGTTFDVLHEALRTNELVNYFTLVEVVEQLLDTGHLQTKQTGNNEKKLQITPVGRAASDKLAPDVPLMVRRKALSALETEGKRRKRLDEVIIEEEAVENGYKLRLAIPDSGSQLLELTVFVPTREQSRAVQRRFLNDPVFLYQNILALLTGDEELLSDIPPERKLFP